MQKTRMPLILTVFSLLLCACSNKFYSAASGTMDQTAATSVKSKLESAVTISFTKPSELPSGMTRDDSLFSACTTSDPVSPTDEDGDGIAKSKKVVYDCVNIAHGNILMNLKGSYAVIDEDDKSKTAGFRYDYDLAGGHTGTDKSIENYLYKGNFEFKGKNPKQYKSDFQGSGENSGSRGYSSKYTYGSSWDHKVIPDDEANPDKSGTIELSGFYGHKHEISGTPPDGTPGAHNFVLKVTSSGIKYQADCSSFYKEGTITFEDASGNKVELTFSCTAVTAKYNGTAI